MRNLLLFLTLLGTCLLSGCATIFADSTDELTIESEPSGASVFLGGQQIGTTPFKTRLARDTIATYLTFRKPGYASKSVYLQKTMVGVAFLNLLWLPTSGTTSWGIDALSGKMFRYNPDSYVAQLEKSTGAVSSALEFTIARFETLREEIVRGETRELRVICPLEGLAGGSCAEFLRDVSTRREALARAPHGLALYRGLRAR